MLFLLALLVPFAAYKLLTRPTHGPIKTPFLRQRQDCFDNKSNLGEAVKPVKDVKKRAMSSK